MYPLKLIALSDFEKDHQKATTFLRGLTPIIEFTRNDRPD